MKKLIAILALVLSAQAALACDMHGVTGIVEDNDLWIGPEVKTPKTMEEADFHKIIDDISAIYAPIIAAKGKELQVIRKWEDGTVNAYAQQQGNIWKVSMFGGLARHETITQDAFALVVCHELGHHLGGAPKKKMWFFSTWASNEGQADYWGNLKCMRRYLENQNNIEIVQAMDVDAYATERCKAHFTLAEDIAICQRGAMAGASLAELFKSLRNTETPLDFQTPDPKIVAKTDDAHPASQCRMDTYFQGALCEVDRLIVVDDNDASVGTCSRARSFDDGLRPLCWFKP